MKTCDQNCARTFAHSVLNNPHFARVEILHQFVNSLNFTSPSLFIVIEAQNSNMDDETTEDLKTLFGGIDGTINERPDVWLKSVRNKLYTMFKSPLKDEYQREAFKWVASLCISIGNFSWIPSEDKWTENEAKIYSLITRLSMSEILILLPLLQRDLTCGEEAEVDQEDGKVMARSANKSEYDAFGDHLVILESTIISLVENQDAAGRSALSECIPRDEFNSLLERLKELMSEICDYLENCQRYWDRLIEKPDSDKFLAFEGCMRVISLWLSEDSASFQPQCKRYLIDLLIRNLSLSGGKIDKDINMTALHSICTQNDELLEALEQNPNHKEALQNYLVHVQKERDEGNAASRRSEKKFKLRCGLVKDLMSMMQQK